MVINKDDGTGEAAAFAKAVGIPVLGCIPADDDIRRKSANYQIIGTPGDRWGPLFEELSVNVAVSPPVHPRPLQHDGLLALFKSEDVGRGVLLQSATLEDMCGGTIIEKPSLEVVYETV
jgi:chlorophyllide a reductase subunit X